MAPVSKGLFSFVIFAYLLGPSLLGFALTFPRPKTFVQRHPRWLLIPFLIGLIPPLLLFINPVLAALGFPITLAMVIAAIAVVDSQSPLQCAIDQPRPIALGGWRHGRRFGALYTELHSELWSTVCPRETSFLSLAAMGFPVMGISLGIAITLIASLTLRSSYDAR